MTYLQKLKRNINIYLIFNALTGLIFSTSISAFFQRRFLSYSEMALTSVIYFVIEFIFEVPSGAIADILGRKKTIIIGSILQMFGFIIVGFSYNFLSINLGYAFVAIGSAFVSGSDTALIYDSLAEINDKESFSKINAKGLIFYRVGIIISTFIGGYLYTVYNPMPYILRAVMYFAAVFICFLFEEPHLDSEKFTIFGYFKTLKNGINDIFKSSTVTRFTLFYVLIAGVSWACLSTLNSAFLRDSGFSEKEATIIYSEFYIVSTVLLYSLINRIKKIDRNVVYFLFYIFLVLGLLPGFFINKWFAMAMFFLVITIGGARFSVLNAFANEEVRSANRATSLSALNQLSNILSIIIVGVGGNIQDSKGTPFLYGLIGIALMLTVGPLVYIINRTKVSTSN